MLTPCILELIDIITLTILAPPRKSSSNFQFLCALKERENIQLTSGLRVEEIAVGTSGGYVEAGNKVNR
jgi:hypothetical protein